ncbi:MAG TPA: hypothetical protein VFC18_20925 [Burkholderiales bacterium]|nr:hypothetical protein [Burkholderiales bacterium]
MKRSLIILALAAAVPLAGAEEKSDLEKKMEKIGRAIDDTLSSANKAAGRGVQSAGKAVEKILPKVEKKPDAK